MGELRDNGLTMEYRSVLGVTAVPYNLRCPVHFSYLQTAVSLYPAACHTMQYPTVLFFWPPVPPSIPSTCSTPQLPTVPTISSQCPPLPPLQSQNPQCSLVPPSTPKYLHYSIYCIFLFIFKFCLVCQHFLQNLSFFLKDFTSLCLRISTRMN